MWEQALDLHYQWQDNEKQKPESIKTTPLAIRTHSFPHSSPSAPTWSREKLESSREQKKRHMHPKHNQERSTGYRQPQLLSRPSSPSQTCRNNCSPSFLMDRLRGRLSTFWGNAESNHHAHTKDYTNSPYRHHRPSSQPIPKTFSLLRTKGLPHSPCMSPSPFLPANTRPSLPPPLLPSGAPKTVTAFSKRKSAKTNSSESPAFSFLSKLLCTNEGENFNFLFLCPQSTQPHFLYEMWNAWQLQHPTKSCTTLAALLYRRRKNSILNFTEEVKGRQQAAKSPAQAGLLHFTPVSSAPLGAIGRSSRRRTFSYFPQITQRHLQGRVNK